MPKGTYPRVYVGSMRAMKKGRHKVRPDETKYTQFVAEAQTTMPCHADIFERVRHEVKTTAEHRAQTAVTIRADLHARRCEKCKTILKTRRNEK